MARRCIECGKVLDSPRLRLCPECKTKRRKEQDRRVQEQYNSVKSSKPTNKKPKKIRPGTEAWMEATTKRRMECMTISEIHAECMKRSLSYGEAQALYYLDRLPDDWGL